MNTAHIPKVSIVMTAYNSSKFIGKTIESLLKQTLGDFELIIVDDCSKDNTVEIIGSFADPRIRLVPNRENQGISRSRNIGLDLARGVYIAMSDHDDISLPTRLEKQVAFLDAHADHIMVAANSILQTGQSQTLPEAVTNPYLLHWTLFYRCPLVHSAICVRRDAMEQASIRYDSTYAYSEDYEIYHQLGRAGKLGMLEEPLVIYLIHAQNTTHSVLDAMGRNGLAFICEQYRDYLGFTDRDDDVALVWNLCNQNIPSGDINELRRLGEFLVEACHRFSDIQRLEETERALLLRDTAETWWRVVRMSAEKTGQPSLLSALRKLHPPELEPVDRTGFGRSYFLAFARRLTQKLNLRKSG